MTKRSIKILLFSDVKGFSKMSEEENLIFYENFNSGVQKDVLSKYKDDILFKNTWGDSMHVVMNDVVRAGKLALDLRDWVSEFDWISKGLSQNLEIRIGLHAGIVSKVFNPIIDNFNYIGKNTSKAARIEPITYEGQVFVSQSYAALLTAQGAGELTCEYIGIRDSATKSGSLNVYLLNRAYT